MLPKLGHKCFIYGSSTMVAVAIVATTTVATVLDEVDVFERLWSRILGWKALLHGGVDVASRLK